jgi:hypothetical protein
MLVEAPQASSNGVRLQGDVCPVATRDSAQLGLARSFRFTSDFPDTSLLPPTKHLGADTGLLVMGWDLDPMRLHT